MGSEAPAETDEDGLEAEAFGVCVIALEGEAAAGRVDKALALKLPELSRARLQALIAEGRVSRDGRPVADAAARAEPGDYRIEIPAPAPAEPQPEAIPLQVRYEDDQLIVIDKPAGMAMHPGPGCE